MQGCILIMHTQLLYRGIQTNSEEQDCDRSEHGAFKPDLGVEKERNHIWVTFTFTFICHKILGHTF